MDLENYMWQVLQEHLLTNEYIQLTNAKMKERMHTLKSILKSTISSNSDKLTEAEATYFKRSLKISIFMAYQKYTRLPCLSGR
jgi:hypothetical protein